MGRTSPRSAAALAERVTRLKRSRRARWREGVFFVEGLRALERAVRRGFEFEAWLHADGRALSERGRELLAGAAVDARCPVPPETLAALSDKEETSELLALVRMPASDPERIGTGERLLVVVAERPTSPGNLGALLRTCDAFGVDGVLVTGHACDVFDPRTVRASAGSLFSVPTVSVPGAREVAAWLDGVRARHGAVHVLGSSARGAVPLEAAAMGPRTVVVLGNETRGLGPAMRGLCDEVAAIPMRGDATSLNLTSAAAILLHEVRRRAGAIL